MFTIISFKICPFVQRVTALLEAKNLPYKIEYISLRDKPQWFLDLSPTGQVPILITNSGTALFESDAIVEYLDEVSNPIEAALSPEQRAIDRAWSYMATKNYLTQCSTLRSADKHTFDTRAENLKKIFTNVEVVLSDGPFFKGQQLSNVDIAWLPLLHRAQIILNHSGYDLFANHPKVQAWQQAIMTTTIAEKSVAEDFEKVFVDFYLSEKTYLGGGVTCSTELDDNSSSRCC